MVEHRYRIVRFRKSSLREDTEISKLFTLLTSKLTVFMRVETRSSVAITSPVGAKGRERFRGVSGITFRNVAVDSSSR